VKRREVLERKRLVEKFLRVSGRGVVVDNSEIIEKIDAVDEKFTVLEERVDLLAYDIKSVEVVK